MSTIVHLREAGGGDGAGRGTPSEPLPRPVGTSALVRALDAALGKLDAAVAGADAAAAVHEARKALKEYRALLRLIDTAVARQARHAAAAVAQSLSAARDRTAAREALEVLRESHAISAGDCKAASVLIGKDDPEAGEVEARRAALRDFAAAARAALAGPLGAEAEAVDVRSGLVKTYRRAHRGEFETSEAIHELRKAVVAHRYQMSFLAEAFGGKGAKRAAKAQKLRDVLGVYHDMDILKPVLDEIEDGLGLRATRRIDAAVRRHQKGLKKDAIKQHAKLFHRSPKAFARQLAKLGKGEVAPGEPEG